MKVKNILLGSAFVLATAATTFCGYIAKRAAQFENSLNQTANSLDECIICCGNRKVIDATTTMDDVKFGAFCGSLNIDLSDANFDRKQYDMDIEVQSGFVCVTLPLNAKVSFNSRSHCGAVIDHTNHLDLPNEILVNIRAVASCGTIIIKHPLITVDIL